jgi:prevent-host-death family protein
VVGAGHSTVLAVLTAGVATAAASCCAAEDRSPPALDVNHDHAGPTYFGTRQVPRTLELRSTRSPRPRPGARSRQPPLFTAGRRPCSRRRSQFRTPPVPDWCVHGVLPGTTLCYMKSYGVRELRQNASMVLREVAAGETIEITSNGHPVAQLIPAAYDPWTALIASKEVTPARTGPADILTRPPRHYGPETTPILLRQDER